MMPNHVTTRCTITGPVADVSRFRETMIVAEDGKPALDFNAAIPMPAVLVGSVSGGYSEEGAALIIARATQKHTFGFVGDDLGLGQVRISSIRDAVGMPDEHIFLVASEFLARNPKYEQEGMAMLRAIVETGYASWHPWAIANWGTKWGAYSFAEISSDPLTIKFETAWSFPTPVFERLVEMFPTLTFDCVTYDEGSNFAGEGQFGALVTHPFEIGAATDELYERAYGHLPEPEEVDEPATAGATGDQP